MRSKSLFILLFCICSAYATDYDMLIDLERAVDSDFSELNVEEVTDDVEDMKERLSFLVENPINLNVATRNELEALPFLNITQVENLQEYIFDYGSMKTIYELALIEGFDPVTIRMMLPFVVVRPTETFNRFSFKNIGKYGKSQLTVKANGTVQPSAEYTDGKYLGKPYGLSIKYFFKHKNFSVGLLGAKSEGEPFDFKYNKGFDFYSGHIAFMNLTKHIKGIFIGDYKLSFGQGLVMRSASSFSSSAFGSNVIFSDNVKPSYSTTETGYFRGLALSFSGKRYNINIFTSHTQYNKNEGYHRTVSDFEKRYKTPSYILGGNFSFFNRYYKVGFTGYYDFADKSFNVGIDYMFSIKRFKFAGETAFDRNFKFATINTLTILCSDNFSFTSLFRYYPVGFTSKLGNAYSRNSLNGETGLFLGFEASPWINWKFTLLSDIFNIDAIKSSVKKPYSGFNVNFKALYSPAENNEGYFKYNVINKEKKGGTYYKHSFTFNYSVLLNKQITIKSTIAANYYNKSFGYLLSFSGGWETKNNLFSFISGASFFDVPNYDNVIYNYEPTILYGYSSPQFYGIGCRFYIILKVNPIKYMSINVKVSDTYYFNSIDAHKTKIETIFNYKF